MARRTRGRNQTKEELPPKVRKRGNGYTYRYSVPIIKEDGTPGRKQTDTKSYPTPEEAYKAGIKIEVELNEGTYVHESNILFVEWAEKAIEIYAAENNLKPSTIEGKLSHLKYARKAFAGLKIKDITPLQVRDFFISLRDKYNLSESAIRGIVSTIRMIFRHAKRLKLIADNPAEDTVMPTVSETFDDLERLEDGLDLPEYLEKEQVADLLKYVKRLAESQVNPKKAFSLRQLYRLIFILTYTGLRIGELCALEVHRADTSARHLRVIATLYIGKGGLRNYQLLTPKNKPSRRRVDFSEKVAAVIENQRLDLKAFRLMCGEHFYSDRKFLFVSYRQFPGYPLDPGIVEYTLKKIIGQAGFPPSITPHSLRHTFTSLSAEAGTSLEDIQKQLGHGSDEITRRVYLHVTEARRKANVDKLDNLLGDLLAQI